MKMSFHILRLWNYIHLSFPQPVRFAVVQYHLHLAINRKCILPVSLYITAHLIVLLILNASQQLLVLIWPFKIWSIVCYPIYSIWMGIKCVLLLLVPLIMIAITQNESNIKFETFVGRNVIYSSKWLNKYVQHSSHSFRLWDPLISIKIGICLGCWICCSNVISAQLRFMCEAWKCYKGNK